MVLGGALTGESISMSGWDSLKLECPEASEHDILFPESYCTQLLRDMMPWSYCVRVMLGLLGLLSWGGLVLGNKGAGFLSDADGAGWRTLVLMALIWGSVEVPVREGRRVDQSRSVQDQIALA